MSASPSAPTSSPASPTSDTTWSAGFSEIAARRLRALLAAAGPWRGHAGILSTHLEAPLDATLLPQALRDGHATPPLLLRLRRHGAAPTTLALHGSGPAPKTAVFPLGDLETDPPRSPEDVPDLLSRALDAALCPLLARRVDLVLLLVRQRLLHTGAQRAALRLHRGTWMLAMPSGSRTALPPRHRWRALLRRWLLDARRPVLSDDHALPILQSLRGLPIHAPAPSAHERLLLQAEIDRLSRLLSLDPLR
jgi:hypothetical protein